MINTNTGYQHWDESEKIVQRFRNLLIEWGEINFRTFPWRLTNDPYTILIAEVMLHRTQVAQVVPVFSKFIAQYPNVLELARASQQELKKFLFSLGLHWRINLIYEMTQKIAELHDMRIPQEKEDLLSLPGISEYIASAVRCFSMNLPEPLIDANTVRVIGRVFGLEIRDSSRRNPRYRKIISKLTDPDRPRDYYYALLDLAHLVCLKKQTPLCHKCPVYSYCFFGQTNVKPKIDAIYGGLDVGKI